MLHQIHFLLRHSVTLSMRSQEADKEEEEEEEEEEEQEKEEVRKAERCRRT